VVTLNVKGYLTENVRWENNLTSIRLSSLSFGDINKDGFQDFIFVGNCGIDCYSSKIYINNGTSLVENSTWQQNLTGVYRSALSFGDIDNDGDLDLALTGNTITSIISKIYINNGTTFAESQQWQSNLTSVSKSALSFGDIDNDGDLDLLLSGKDSSSNKFTSVYLNNETSLVEDFVWKNNLANVEDSSLALADFDNDGDLDLSLTGCCDIHRIYRNNGTTFVEINREITGGLVGVFAGSQAFGDYDNDGYLDLITNGRETYTTLYLYNISASNFTSNSQDPEQEIMNLRYSSIAWIDLDNDTDLDLIETGINNSELNSLVYTNNRSLTKNNTQPNASTSSFSSIYSNNILKLGWGNGSDAETNTSGLYYNLMIGNSTQNHTIVSGIYGGSSNPTAGYFGNMMQRKNITLNLQLESNATYYWYVQTIDTGLAKSTWSVAQNFTTSLDVSKPNVTVEEPSPSEGNHTTNPIFIFNVTVTDANVTNVTLYSDFNGTLIANETNSSGINGVYVFNKTLDTDGTYNWYIKACDGDNNCNSSSTRNFYLDRGYPIVTLVSPANASTSTSASVTFSYNVSDVDISSCSLIIDGSVDQTDNSITEDTTQTFTKSLSNGNYNWYVNCTDYVSYVNNSLSWSLTVTVPASPTSPGGGGGGSSSGSTVITPTPETTEPVKETETGETANITPEKPVTIKSFDKSTGVKEIQIQVNNEAQNVKVIITKYDSKPSSVSVEKTGKIYKYLQIETENLDEKLKKAIITIQVEKNWTSNNGIDKENLALFKFNNETNMWNELVTNYTSEDDTFYYYDVELTSFSYFVISEKVIVAIPKKTGIEGLWIYILISILILVLVALLSRYLLKKHPNRFNKKVKVMDKKIGNKIILIKRKSFKNRLKNKMKRGVIRWLIS